jgi:fucose permease
MKQQQRSSLSITTIGVGALMALIGGIQYMFGALNPHMKSLFSLNQYECNLIGTSLNAGSFCGIIPSIVNDMYGTRQCCALSALCLFIGNCFVFIICHMNHHSMGHEHKLIALCGSFFLIGIGGSASYISATSYNMKQLSDVKHRGKLGGFLSACLGISGAMFGFIFRYAFHSHFQPFMTFMALFCSLPPIIGYLYMNDSVEIETTDSSNIQQKLQLDEIKAGVKQTFSNYEFWIYVYCIMIGAGSGLVIVNNLSNITIAYGGESDLVVKLILLLSVGSCIGRFTTGMLSDRFLTMVPRTFFLMLNIVGVTLSLWIFSRGILDILPLSTFLTGFSYGGIFSIEIPIVSERFNFDMFAVNLR